MGVSFLSDYHAWLIVADTGLPRNIIGYIVQACLSPLRSDPFAVAPYNNPKEIAECGSGPNAIGARSFLPENMPEREGPRPEILKWMAPNRQSSQLADEEIHKHLAQAIDEPVAAHSAHVVVKTSVLEKSGDALHIADNITTPHKIAKNTKREIAHVHTGAMSGDYSMHMCLAPTDCKEVTTKKWGEKMTLAGTLVPQEYLLVYTPRTKEEVAVVKGIVNAAIVFMTGARDFIE